MLTSPALETLLRRNPLLYIDAGARGDLEGDWARFPKGCLSVLAFEPDESAQIDWENKDALRHLERVGLWSHETRIDIHIGKIPSTSSVWPPNMDYLERFARAHVDPRSTQSVAQVKARPLDAVLAERGMAPDFLKIDTQGAEFQILQGSLKALDDSLMGAVVETWTVPVHKGQGLTHDIMALMYDHGFVVCQIETAAAWDRTPAEKHNVSHRRQIVGLDILFLRDPVGIEARFRDATYAAKYAVIAQMYGHYDFALEALDAGLRLAKEDKDLLDKARQDLLDAYAATKAPPQPPPAPKGIFQKFRDRRKPQIQIAPRSETKLHY